MAQDTLYYCVTAGEPLRTRAILPYSLIKYFNLDIKLGEPDEHFPSEYPGAFVPAYRFADGETLTESIPIDLLLAEKVQSKYPILGNNSPAAQAEILQWLNILNNELMVPIATQFTMVVGRRAFSYPDWGSSGAAVNRYLSILNSYLTEHTFLVGENVTLADLYGVTMLLRGLQVLWGPDVRAKFPAVIRWFNTVSRSPIFGGFFETLEFTKESQKPKEVRN